MQTAVKVNVEIVVVVAAFTVANHLFVLQVSKIYKAVV